MDISQKISMGNYMEISDNSIFIDTWGWLTFFDNKEQFHKEVKSCLKSFTDINKHLVTSDYIFDETNTILFRRLPFSKALKAQNEILKLIKHNYIDFIRIEKTIFEKANELRKKYKDKPDISFTDLTSFAIMEFLNIKNVLTYDKHFEIVGLGFRRLPKL